MRWWWRRVNLFLSDVYLPACSGYMSRQGQCSCTVHDAGTSNDRPQMKLLILAPFAAAIVSSIIWYEAAERSLTQTQKATCGAIALVAWILVFVVGNIVT